MAKLKPEEVRWFQEAMNNWDDRYLKNVKAIKVDGVAGDSTRQRAELEKFYMGFGRYRTSPTGDLTPKFKRALKDPKGKHMGARTLAAGAARRRRQRKAQASAGNPSRAWGGCRGVTNEIIRIVGNDAPVGSRKRTATYGNPRSDHHVSQIWADAIDFRIANAYSLAKRIARELGGEWSGDYDSFYITRNGKRFRVQIIAGTHGTGPHLHVGVRRA